MRDFFPTGKFKNARIAPHNRRPKMAINKRRFSQEATYARRCFRGRSCACGRVVPSPPPSLVKFRAWVCKTAGPLECEKNSPIRILRFQRRAGPSVLFPARRPQQTPGATGETAGTSAAGPVLSALPSIRKPQQAPGAARETAGASRRRAGSVCPAPCQEAAAGPRSHRGDRRCLRRRAGSVCSPPCQEAAAGPRSRQGGCRGHRRRGGYFQCQEGL